MAEAIAPPNPQAAHFQLLLELAYELPGSLDIGEVLTRSLAATRRLIDFRGGSIQLIEEGFLRIAAADPEVSPEVAELRLPLATGLSGRAATTGTTIYSPDLDHDPRVDPDIRRLGSNQGIHSYLAVPVVASGEVVGVLQIDSSTPDAFSEEQRSMIATLAPLMGSAIQNAQIFAAELEVEDRARDLDRLRTSFLTITTHELRTPLSAMVGFAELLMRHDLPRVMDVHEVVGRLRKSVDKMRYLVAQMERATRIPASIADPKPAQIAPALEAAVAQVRDRRSIVIDIDPRLPRARFDADLLTEALDALLTNSMNFSPEDSVVSIEARQDDGWITIAVIDRGPGVAPEDARRIFEPFAQLQDPHTREVGGLGMGLATARALVEQMGGRLDVVPGDGGRFEISLRVEKPS